MAGNWNLFTLRCCTHFIGQRRTFCNAKNFKEWKKLLVLQKTSRLDIERLRHPELNEQELKTVILKRGTNYNSLVKHHENNARFQTDALQVLQNAGLTTRTANKFNYTESSIDWCDAVVTLGGDGTFLLAANKIADNSKPIIGLNSDPCRSEGHLCLPKSYSTNIPLAIHKIMSGKFRWMFRSRIRVTVTGGSVDDAPVELHHQAIHGRTNGDRRKVKSTDAETAAQMGPRVLPVLALNEIFLGESLAAKVSYFELKANGSSEVTRVKSSGVLVSTGTGSTSWHLSTNRLNDDDVTQLLRIYSDHAACDIDPKLVAQVTQQFNNRFIFAPDDSKIGYTIRDLIYAGVWPKPKGRLAARGFVDKLEIKSRCSDAGLVIDGGIVFPFNDGASATLETSPNSALRTVFLDEQ